MEYYLLLSTRYLTLKSIHYVIYFLLSFCIVFFLWGAGHAPPEIFGNEYALRCNLVHFETQF